jgi:hypothetical protein
LDWVPVEDDGVHNEEKLAMARQRKHALGFLTFVILLGAGPSAQADTIAVGLRSNGYQGSGFNQNIGWEFTTNATITVTQLGWFDFTFPPVGGPGFAVNHTIGLFTGSGTLLVSGMVSAGTGDPVDGPPVTNTAGQVTGFFRYVPVTPTTLAAGQTYVIAGTNSPDPFDPFAVGFPLSDLMTDPAISFVQGRVSPMGTGGALLFPAIAEPPAILNARNFGPNFQFVAGTTPAVPEPAGFVLGGLAGLFGLGYAWRRRAA